ncbi:MAG: phage tail tape measure C-terminal domain-containing protein [Pseudomonadota bacterium]
MAQGVTVDFTANLARFSSQIDRATNDLTKFKNDTSRIAGSLKTAFAGLAAGFSIAGIGKTIGDVIDFQDQMGKLAQKTGITTESLSTLSYVAELNGTNLDALSVGIKSLSTGLSEAAKGSKEYATMFDALGVGVQDASGALRGSEQVLLDVADRFAGMEDGATKTALAVKLFGESGMQMIPMLNNGAAAIKAMQEEARKFGVEVSGDAAKASAEFNDNMLRLKTSAEGLGRSLSNSALPSLVTFTDFLVTGDGSKLPEWMRVTSFTLFKLKQEFVDLGDAIGAGMAILDTNVGSGMWEQIDFILDERRRKRAELEEETLEFVATLEGMNKTITFSGGGVVVDSAAVQESLAGIEEQRKALAALQREGESVFNSTRTPLEQLSAEYERLNGLLAEGAIDVKTHGRAMEKAIGVYDATIPKIEQVRDAWDDVLDIYIQEEQANQKRWAEQQAGLNAFVEANDDAAKRITDAVHGWGRAFTDTLADGVMNGKLDFASLADSIIRDLLRMQIQAQITMPLLSSFGGSGGGLMSMFGFADGGIMTSSGPMPLKMYASGGIANSPQVAMFGEGSMNEAFVPLPDGHSIPVTLSGGGGRSGIGNVQVNIYNEGGAPLGDVDVTAILNEAREMVIDVVVRDIRRGGSIDGAIKGAYGLQRGGGYS